MIQSGPIAHFTEFTEEYFGLNLKVRDTFSSLYWAFEGEFLVHCCTGYNFKMATTA